MSNVLKILYGPLNGDGFRGAVNPRIKAKYRFFADLVKCVIPYDMGSMNRSPQEEIYEKILISKVIPDLQAQWAKELEAAKKLKAAKVKPSYSDDELFVEAEAKAEADAMGNQPGFEKLEFYLRSKSDIPLFQPQTIRIGFANFLYVGEPSPPRLPRQFENFTSYAISFDKSLEGKGFDKSLEGKGYGGDLWLNTSVKPDAQAIYDTIFSQLQHMLFDSARQKNDQPRSGAIRLVRDKEIEKISLPEYVVNQGDSFRMGTTCPAGDHVIVHSWTEKSNLSR